MTDQLKPYQDTLSKRVRRDRSLISLRYGAGKTWVALIAIQRLISTLGDRDYGCAALWFTKNRLAGTAVDEILKRSSYLPEKWEDMDGPPQPYSIVVIPHTWIRTRTKEIKQLILHHKPACVTFDESTKIKSPSTKISTELHKLAGVHQTAVPKGLRLCLTGNPCPEGPHEFWSQFQFLYTYGNPLGNTYYRFLKKWFIQLDHDRVLNALTRKRFWETVKKHTLYMNKAEWAEYKREYGLEKNYVTLTYTPSAEQIKLMKQLQNEWSLPTGDGGDEEWYDYSLTVGAKALQISNGFYYSEEREVVYLKSSPKADLLCGTLEDLLNEASRQVIVWFHYDADRRMLIQKMQRFIEYGIAIGPSEEELHRFERGEARIILMPVTVSEGFNELVVADTQIFFTNTYSQEMRDQAEHRIDRLSQQSPTVTYIDLVGEGMRDDEMRIAVAAKNPELIAHAVRSILP
jgi:hypothetical protein